VSDTLHRVPSLFRRRSTEPTEVATESAEVATESAEVATESAEVATESAEVATESAEVATESADPSDDTDVAAGSAAPPGQRRPKGYTPSKRELGQVTPKRPGSNVRRAAEPPPATRREAYKRMRRRQRAERQEQRAGMLAGEERYLLPRDRGPERALVRDIVDSRRTVGVVFFTFAIVLFLSTLVTRAIPPIVLLVFNAFWALLALAVVVDSYFISRRVKQLITERYPKTNQRMMSLYLYAVMRGVTYRRLRMPKPRVRIGTKI
jgi:hypothetical protein